MIIRLLVLFLLIFYCLKIPSLLALQDAPQTVRYYLVTAPSTLLAKQAAISFHSSLLENRGDLMVMALSQAQVVVLIGQKFRLTEIPNWLRQFNQEQRMLMSEQKKQLTGIPGYPCYPTVEETFQTANQLVSQYPNLAEWIDIGDSWDKVFNNSGYDIMLLKLTNQQVQKVKPILFVQSAIHAREYTPAALTLDFAKEILFRYGRDADSQWILDEHEIHLVIQLNPDGRKMAEQGRLWRKNTNSNYCSTNASQKGADLNRNFSFSWAQTSNGSSSDPCNDRFHGVAAASEPEIQAIESYLRSIYPDRRGDADSDAAPLDTQGLHLDIHSYSELILWPWGHLNADSGNARELERLGRKLAFWSGYTPMQSIGLYPTDGTSESISYGELGIPEITFELGTQFFQSCSVYQNQVKPDNMPALYYAAKIVRAPYQLPFGPDIQQLTLNGTKNGQLLAGEPLQLSGVAIDGLYNAAGSIIEAQAISGVAVYIDQLPWSNGAQAIFATADDGSFNSIDENFTLTIDTTHLTDGKHLITVQAMDSNQELGAVSAAYLVVGAYSNSPPAPVFNFDCQNGFCQFDASATSDDGLVVDYKWQISDGAVLVGQSPSYNFSSETLFNVQLGVTDDFGVVAETSQNINIQAKPIASFVFNCNQLKCQFDGANSRDLSGSISDYQWSFGDGGEAIGVAVSHVFPTSARYVVELQVTDDEGDYATIRRTVSLSIPVVPLSSSGGGGGSLSLFLLLWLVLGNYLIKRR